MKILLLISETGKGNSLIVNEILKIRDIKLEVITINKRKSLFSKITNKTPTKFVQQAMIQRTIFKSLLQ